MSNSIAPGSSADVNVKVTALTTNPNVPVTYKTIILKKNLVNGVNTLTQEMMSATNTKYIIKYDYMLGENITIPKNCILEFDGGSISASGSNDTITGSNTYIQAGLIKIFNTDVTLNGTWNVAEVYPEWFGAKGDGITDDTIAFQYVVDSFSDGLSLKLSNKVYVINELNISNCSNIEIAGYTAGYLRSDSLVSPTSKNITILKSSILCPYVIKISDEQESKLGKGITIKNLAIDGNNKATIGINASFAVNIENVNIANCVQDGIELAQYTFPVIIDKCFCSRNGRHGISCVGKYSTVFYIKNTECAFNQGYGIYINNGSCISVENCIIESNHTGGLRIEKTNDSTYLNSLFFANLYFENNGLLTSDNEWYQGNHTLYITSNDINPLIIGNKIENIVFNNCVFYKPSSVSVDDMWIIEGVANIKFNNCSSAKSFETQLDATKNYINTDSIYKQLDLTRGVSSYNGGQVAFPETPILSNKTNVLDRYLESTIPYENIQLGYNGNYFTLGDKSYIRHTIIGNISIYSGYIEVQNALNINAPLHIYLEDIFYDDKVRPVLLGKAALYLNNNTSYKKLDIVLSDYEHNACQFKDELVNYKLLDMQANSVITFYIMCLI